jgi:hypothetical protein
MDRTTGDLERSLWFTRPRPRSFRAPDYGLGVHRAGHATRLRHGLAPRDPALAGEGFSGLARGFFYAGARSLLVSHWAVASAATVNLTTALFRSYASDSTLGRAEALQRALWEQPATAHPL